MEKIKIAFIISNLGQGGAENQFVKLITNLDKSRFDICLFLYAAQTEPFFERELQVHQIKTTKIRLKHRFVPFKIAEALYRINRFLAVNRFDIVVTSLFMNNLFVRVAAPRGYKNKIITNMRTSIQNYSSFYKFFEKRLISTSYIVFNSNQSLLNFKKILPVKFHNRLFLIYNGYLIPAQSVENKSPDFVFGCLGRLSAEKNILQVVRVFPEIEANCSMCKLVIQGHFSNQYPAIREAIVSKNIEIREKHPNIEEFYSNISILVLPSIFEGCPNVLFEALLRKKLCIVSAGANSDGFIKNGVNGFVYDGSDDGLKNAMQNAMQIRNSAIEQSIIHTGYQYAFENFRIDAMVAKYAELFIKVYEHN